MENEKADWKESVKYFDEAASGWDEKPERTDMAKAVAQAIINGIVFFPEMKVMDFGCGTGLLSFQLAMHAGTVIAADQSNKMLAMVEKKSIAMNMDNVLTRLLDNSEDFTQEFDLIAVSMVLHHINDVSRQLDDFTRWTKTGGYLAIADLNQEDGTFHERSGQVHNGFDPIKLAGELEHKGWDIKIVPEVYQIRRNNRHYDIFLMIAKKMKK